MNALPCPCSMMTANNNVVQMPAMATDGVLSTTASSVVLRIARCVPKIPETMTMAMIIGPRGDQQIGLRLHTGHALQDHARSGEGLRAEEDPGDVDEEEGQQREAERATRGPA